MAVKTYTLMVEVLELLTEDEVLKQCRASATSLQTELFLNVAAEIRCHEFAVVVNLNLLQPLTGVNLAALGTATKSRRVGKGACRQSSADKAAQR